MKILIVDDHTLFREGLSHILQQLDDALQTIEASSYETALTALADCPDVDFVLLDLNMPGKDGFSVLEQVGLTYPFVPIAVLSASRRQSEIDKVLNTQAMGFIPKDSSGQVMLDAVRLMMAGGIYKPTTTQMLSSISDTSLSGREIQNLTPRQREVLSMLALGDSNKKIADQLFITEATTKMHITAIFKFLGVSNRTQATIEALKLGY
jgi:DNA-binding NarL/FixJ family response regulator